MKRSADFTRDPIPDESAFALLDRWRDMRADLGLIYVSVRKQIYARTTVRSRTARSLELRGEKALARIALNGVEYSYGPLQIFPRWPLGPMETVTALEVHWPEEAWLWLFGNAAARAKPLPDARGSIGP